MCTLPCRRSSRQIRLAVCAIALSMGASTVALAQVPVVTSQPASTSVSPGATLQLGLVAQGVTSWQWLRNGVEISGANAATFVRNNFQVADAGTYSVRLSNASGSIESRSAVVGVVAVSKVTDGGIEVGRDIVHPNGNIYDQVLLTGPSATITADPGQVTRVSFIDTSNDIVQVEFGGAGTLTILIENATGPAAPVKYNQPSVTYIKGHASLILSGANETTNVSVFSVGRANAVNQSLFPPGEVYDGFADIGLISIASANGKFGGVRAANAACFHIFGMTGVYAPGVAMQGPVFIGDITADLLARPVIVLGSSTDVRITGGNLVQFNGAAVEVDGILQLNFADGTTSGGVLLPGMPGRPPLRRNGVDVTAQLLDSIPTVTSQSPPVYPFALKQAGITGDVLMQFIVDSNGITTDVVTLSATHAEFAAASAAAILTWRFKPGRKDGRPVATRLQIPIVFSLN